MCLDQARILKTNSLADQALWKQAKTEEKRLSPFWIQTILRQQHHLTSFEQLRLSIFLTEGRFIKYLGTCFQKLKMKKFGLADL